MFSVSDEGKIRLLSKFVDDHKTRTAVEKDEVLDEEIVEVLPEEWNLEPDEFLLVTEHLNIFGEIGKESWRTDVFFALCDSLVEKSHT